MSEAYLATSVPVIPIATPMWACLRAGASLTPSPVIATISPYREYSYALGDLTYHADEYFDKFSFVSGFNSAEHFAVVARKHLASSLLVHHLKFSTSKA
jgi:hypothetical protein